MSVFKLLNLKNNATKEEVRQKYIRKLLMVHPDRNNGLRDEYMNLKNEYERYVKGEMDENPYVVCSRNDIDSLVCRCGGRYKGLYENLGRIECEYCSCFVELTDDPVGLPR